MRLRAIIAAAFARPSKYPREGASAPEPPPSLLRFVLISGGWHQAAVCALSVAVSLLNAAPIETQRRIIDTAVHRGPIAVILSLVLAQCTILIVYGLAKLAMNIYRAWLGECATQDLRLVVTRRLAQADEQNPSLANGTGLAMILAEADDIGGFVGASLSLPIVEAGFLISVFIYLAALDLEMMAASLLILAPQFVFIPMMQRAINRRIAQRTRLLRRFGDEMLSPGTWERGAQRLDEVFTVDMGVFKVKFSLNFLMNLTTSVGSLLVLGIGSVLVVHGRTEIATVVTFLSAVGRIVDPWNDIVDWGRGFAMTMVKYDLVVQALAGPPPPDDGARSGAPRSERA